MVAVVAAGVATPDSDVSAAASRGQSEEQYEQEFRAITGPAGQEFVDELRSLEQRLGIDPGDGKLTVREVRRADDAAIIAALQRLIQLLSDTSYIAGLSFAISALAKFLAHRIDPKQVPTSAAVVLLFVAAVLTLLPSLFPIVGATVFGDGGAMVVSDIEPLLKEAKQTAQDQEDGGADDVPLLRASSALALEQSLQGRGLSGDALEAAAQLELLAAGVAIANARY